MIVWQKQNYGINFQWEEKMASPHVEIEIENVWFWNIHSATLASYPFLYEGNQIAWLGRRRNMILFPHTNNRDFVNY